VSASATGRGDADRYASERRFHDELVKKGGERGVGRFYAVNRSSWSFYRGLLLEEAARARGTSQGRILEYGSGIGAYSSLALAEAGYESTGIDLSEESVRVAQENAARKFPGVAIDYLAMNGEALDFPDASFGLVCGNGILHHLDLERAFSEISRVLAPDGRAVFSEPLGHNPFINLYRRLTPSQRTPDEHPLRATDLELARRFFGTVETWYYHLFALAAIPLSRTRAFERVLPVLDRADRSLFDHLPASGRYAWFVIMRMADPLRPARS
jgi:SAM-dependent methyltransferase